MISSKQRYLALALALSSVVTSCKVENRGGGTEARTPASTNNPAVKLDAGLKATNHDALQCHLDLASGLPVSGTVVVSRGQGASFEGWAFETGQGVLPESLLVFQGTAGSYYAKVKGGAERPDVANSFGPELGKAGFTTVVDISNVAAGEYVLWLATGMKASDKACNLKATVKIEE